MTATRFWFPSTGAAAVFPAYSGVWNYTSGSARTTLNTTPGNTNNVAVAVNSGMSGTLYRALNTQFVSDVLPAQTIGGTFSIVAGMQEGSNFQDLYLYLVINVWDAAGTTFYGQAYAGPGVLEMDSTTAQVTRALSSVTLSDVVAPASCRVTVEVGSQGLATSSASGVMTLRRGDRTVDADYPTATAGQASPGFRGWCEFSADLFNPPPPPTPPDLGDYLVDLTIDEGTVDELAYTVAHDDLAGYGLADPLVIGWQIPDSSQRPSQPDPMYARFSVVVAAVADLSTVGIGSTVKIEVRTGATLTDPDVTFYGRITQPSAKPHPLGMVYTFEAVDYTPDLQGLSAGQGTASATSVGNLVNQAVLDAGDVFGNNALPNVYWYQSALYQSIDAPTPDYLVAEIGPLSERMVTLLDSLPATADYWTAPSGYNRANTDALMSRIIIAPVRYGGVQVWALEPVGEAYTPDHNEAPNPGRFGVTAGGYGPTFAVNAHAGAIDACRIDFAASWTATRRGGVNKAVVKYQAVSSTSQATATVTDGSDGPFQVANRDTLIKNNTGGDGAALARALGRLMIPPASNSNGWQLDRFRWWISRDDSVAADGFPVIFPDHGADPNTRPVVRTAAYNRPIVILGVPDAQNPADRGNGYYAGQLSAVELVVAGGDIYADLTMTPSQPMAGPGALSFAELRDGWATIRYNQLDTAFNFIDYRLLED